MWLNDNEIWYYLDNNGAMVSDTTIDGYYLGKDGAWDGKLYQILTIWKIQILRMLS